MSSECIQLGKKFDNSASNKFDDTAQIITIVGILTIISLLMMYSSDGLPITIRHAIKAIFICSICAATSFLNLRSIRKLVWPCYIAVTCMLIYVAVFGHVGKGAQRWIYFAGFEFQPSEAMKLFLPMAILDIIDKRDHIFNLGTLSIVAVISVIPIFIILKQPDLGTALLVIFIALSAVFIAGIPARWLIIGTSSTILSSPLIWYKLHTYQQKRILNLLYSDFDPQNSGYHIMQSMIAIGSGGLLGKGFMSGSQVQLKFLPEHRTDFVFAHFAEQFGFIGCIFLLILYLLLIHRLFRMSESINDFWSKATIQVIAIYIATGTVINIGMVIGLLPVVGVPLPFISYGGTNFLIFSLALTVTFICRQHNLHTRAFK